MHTFRRIFAGALALVTALPAVSPTNVKAEETEAQSEKEETVYVIAGNDGSA